MVHLMLPKTFALFFSFILQIAKHEVHELGLSQPQMRSEPRIEKVVVGGVQHSLKNGGCIGWNAISTA